MGGKDLKLLKSKSKGAKNKKKCKSKECDQALYYVEAIRDKKFVEGSGDMYLVKWSGYESEDNTWEPRSNLVNCWLLEAYEAKLSADGQQERPETPANSSSGGLQTPDPDSRTAKCTTVSSGRLRFKIITKNTGSRKMKILKRNLRNPDKHGVYHQLPMGLIPLQVIYTMVLEENLVHFVEWRKDPESQYPLDLKTIKYFVNQNNENIRCVPDLQTDENQNDASDMDVNQTDFGVKKGNLDEMPAKAAGLVGDPLNSAAVAGQIGCSLVYSKPYFRYEYPELVIRFYSSVIMLVDDETDETDAIKGAASALVEHEKAVQAMNADEYDDDEVENEITGCLPNLAPLFEAEDSSSDNEADERNNVNQAFEF